MAVITVTSGRFDGAQGLSLREAIEQAMATPEADVIRFSADMAGAERFGPVQLINMPGAAQITASGGALTIIGDIDGDGLTDVVVDADEGRHFDVQTGASLTLRNLDLVGALDIAGRGEEGARGANGVQGGRAEGFKENGQDGADGVFDEAQDGADGEGGFRGDDSAGAIMNLGSITLVRVGFARNTAIGGTGGDGGAAGAGAFGQLGADGKDTDIGFDPVFPPPLPVEIPLASQTETPDIYPASFDFGYEDLLDGGSGGDGAPGGNGGRGGDGGPGGDAGVIFNAPEATLTMQDVVFGGVLTSGLVGRGNSVRGGGGGAGGQAGSGGNGGHGGDGGDGAAVRETASRHIWLEDENRWEVRFTSTYDVSRSGAGGNGGDGGNPGEGGDGGDSGRAAAVLNQGSASGAAAFASGAIPDGTNHTPFNNVRSTDPNRLALPFTGFVGQDGNGGDGGDQFPQNLVTFEPAFTRSKGFPPASDRKDDYDLFWANVSSASGVIPAELTDPAADGISGNEGVEVHDDPEHGEEGDALNGVFGDGSASVQAAGTLIYVSDAGPSDGAIKFNIARIGMTGAEHAVSWRIVGRGDEPVSGADFAGASSGRATFESRVYGRSDTEDYSLDRDANVIQVSVALAGDSAAEGTEGYRIELFGLSGEGAALGAASANGQVTDADEGEGGGETPPRATNGRDRFTGDGGRDRYDGKGGNDVISGKGGRDVLNGGNGKDRIDGGRGNDVIDGDRGNDRLKGGAGKDDFRFARGDGKDVITDFRLNQDDIQIRGVKRFAQLDIEQQGRHAVIDHGRRSDEIKLLRVDVDDLDARDFIFS
ncbi:MAG: hypothetical protein AAF676_14075 [Pseudomonadota bacterium]